jgi:S-adenosylmethionine synthetase
MFGYATDETPELLPMTILLAHNLNKEMAARRRDGSMGWLRPDSSNYNTIDIN